MITFISYAPGARGKFITELCERSVKNPKWIEITTMSGGNVFWWNVVGDHFKSIGIGRENSRIISPELDNYKFYVDSVRSALLKFSHEDFFVDTHCIEYESLNYMLESGCKVVRIIVTDSNQIETLKNDFFYKNFVAGPGSDNEKLDFATMIIKRRKNKDPNNDYTLTTSKFHLPLKQWGEEALAELYNTCTFFNKQKENIIIHDNLLEVNYSDLLKIETISKIIKFVDGEMNDRVKKRFNEYVQGQNEIPPFDVYIKDFIKC